MQFIPALHTQTPNKHKLSTALIVAISNSDTSTYIGKGYNMPVTKKKRIHIFEMQKY